MSRGGTSPIPWKRRRLRERQHRLTVAHQAHVAACARDLCLGLFVLDGDDEPVPCTDIHEWGRFMMEAPRHVADTRNSGLRVSTIFLGLDHGFGGRRLLWETCVFGGELDGEQERYGTREEAEAGHAVMLARVERAGEPLH